MLQLWRVIPFIWYLFNRCWCIYHCRRKLKCHMQASPTCLQKLIKFIDFDSSSNIDEVFVYYNRELYNHKRRSKAFRSRTTSYRRENEYKKNNSIVSETHNWFNSISKSSFKLLHNFDTKNDNLCVTVPFIIFFLALNR